MPVSLNGKSDPKLSNTFTDHYWHNRLLPGGFGHFHFNCNWDATYFFEDPLARELWDAIEAKDLELMQSLVERGADVNSPGKEGMTLLYWAFHMADDPRPFGYLLEQGANPNVICKINLNRWYSHVMPGNAVVHLVAQGTYNRHFKSVFDHGGDPNLPSDDYITDFRSPLNQLYWHAPDVLERLKVLIDCGVDLNQRTKQGTTFLSRYSGASAIACQLALLALENGADWTLIYDVKGRPYRVIHFLAQAEPKAKKLPIDQYKHYQKLIEWLENRGESLEKAKKDLKEWGQKKVELRHRRDIGT